VIRIRKSKNRQHNGKKKKFNRTNNDLQNITQKTDDWVTKTPLKTGGELRCSGRVGSSCSSSVKTIISLKLSFLFYSENSVIHNYLYNNTFYSAVVLFEQSHFDFILNSFIRQVPLEEQELLRNEIKAITNNTLRLSSSWSVLILYRIRQARSTLKQCE
jgi:hypothetical protein